MTHREGPWVIVDKRPYGPRVYRKRSYDAFNGNWTPYVSKAQTWKTVDGAIDAVENIERFSQVANMRVSLSIETVDQARAAAKAEMRK